jgi:hypothetical protein
MTEKTYKCWDADTYEDEAPAEIVARSPEAAATTFIEQCWDGGVEYCFVKVRDGAHVSRYKVTIETRTEFSTRRCEEKS